MTKLRNTVSDAVIDVTATKDHPASSYGHDVWVDANNEAMCQVGLEAASGYEVLDLEADRLRQYYRQRIGRMIVRERNRQKLTQQDLADRSGVNQPHIARLERGVYAARIDYLSNIAEALDCTIEIVRKK